EPRTIWVDRERALFSAWYELFPRSEGAVLARPGRPAIPGRPAVPGGPGTPTGPGGPGSGSFTSPAPSGAPTVSAAPALPAKPAIPPTPAQSGTFATAAKRLPAVAAMGFDIVYLPPIHPIGRVNRKGRNNALVASDTDVGSPWAIGSDEGGHD